MSIFKRLSATLVASIDQAVGEIENHDAVIQANLNEIHKKIAEAKVRLNHIYREEALLKQQMQAQKKDKQRWHQRAVKAAQNDEATALECVRRSQHCQQQIEGLQQSLSEHVQTSKKLACNIENSEQNLNDKKQKLILMRARQSICTTASANTPPESSNIQFMDETFDRWEINISQTEMHMDTSNTVIFDPIEQTFIDQEQQDELRKELTTLLAQESQK